MISIEITLLDYKLVTNSDETTCSLITIWSNGF